MKRILLLSALTAGAYAAMWGAAPLKCQGTVVDAEGEPLVGATVTVPGTHEAAVVDIDGNFSITLPEGKHDLHLEYVGYHPLTVKASAKMGNIVMEPNETVLQDVVVTQSIGRPRKTPVAISTLDAPVIEARLGNQEFPEVLRTTPGIWVTKDGGGYGDAKISMRGFSSNNVGMLVNGVPVNDMESGRVYWSNWAGLSDVTASMQTQRGLGAAIVSVPSVGGTVNITTRSLDAKKGGSIWYGMGNDGLNQIGFSLSTGMMKNGWAITVLGSRKWSDGYVQGTPSDSYTWFVNVSKRINDKNQISLTAFGSPQWHDQRNSNDGLSIMAYQDARNWMNGESPYRYNSVFGYDNEGQVRTTHKNQFHKPQISLNHIWQINERSSLSSAIYLSLGSGYGYSGQGRGKLDGVSYSSSSWYGTDNTTGLPTTQFRRVDGTFDYGAVQDLNASSTEGSYMIMAKNRNDHTWLGLISTYKNELIRNKLNLLAGIDVRYYEGRHKATIEDLYWGEYYMDDYYRGQVLSFGNNPAAAADPNYKYQKLGVGDVVYRNYNGYTMQEGVYAQLEYQPWGNKFTAILAGSVSNTGYWRKDFFYYDGAKSETRNFFAGNIKAGANWNIDRHNNVYINGGYFSRAPYFSGGVFLSSQNSNVTNPNPYNEKCGAIELGYEFHSPIFSAVVNAYFTKWIDKTTTKSVDLGNNERGAFNMNGVNARHMGIEANATFRPCRYVELTGMLSIGDYQWDSNATGYFYNSQGLPLADVNGALSADAIASGVFAPDHAHAVLNQKGRKVGGSAQSTGALGLTLKPIEGLRIGVDWTASARNYSDYSVSTSAFEAGKAVSVADPWRIPWGNQLDLSASYRFKIGGLDATVYGNIYNVCNYNYVVDAYTSTASNGTWENATRVFYNFGRTFAVRLKINF